MSEKEYLAFIQSEHVVPQTRKALLEREEKNPLGPVFLDADTFAILECLAECLIPQSQSSVKRIPVAALLDRKQAAKVGNGWRYASMPADDVALREGLKQLDSAASRLHGASFIALEPADQDALITRVQAGEESWPGLEARRWLEEVHADLVGQYVSSPAILASMGFSGIGDAEGWTAEQLLMPASWEPKANVS